MIHLYQHSIFGFSCMNYDFMDFNLFPFSLQLQLNIFRCLRPRQPLQHLRYHPLCQSQPDRCQSSSPLNVALLMSAKKCAAEALETLKEKCLIVSTHFSVFPFTNLFKYTTEKHFITKYYYHCSIQTIRRVQMGKTILLCQKLYMVKMQCVSELIITNSQFSLKIQQERKSLQDHLDFLAVW